MVNVMKFTKKTVLLGVTFVLGVTLGGLQFGSAIASTLTQEHTPTFPVNEKGETYGSAENVESNAAPDLIQAIGVDGTHGYIRAEDLETEPPKSPKEALSKQQSISLNSVRTIPLYDINGKQIGTFNIQQVGDSEVEIETISE
jgi:hypothetical protein